MALNRQTFTSTSLSGAEKRVRPKKSDDSVAVKVVVGRERSFQASPELKLPGLISVLVYEELFLTSGSQPLAAQTKLCSR